MTNPFPPPDPEVRPYQSAVEVALTKKVNLAQLTDEIEAATKVDVNVAMTYGPDFDTTRAPAPDNPAVLHVSPARVRQDQVEKVLAAHEPTADYGAPEGESEFGELLARVLDDPTATLADDEVKIAVLGLLRRVPLLSRRSS
jgi:hypothetical protein